MANLFKIPQNDKLIFGHNLGIAPPAQLSKLKFQWGDDV